MAQVKEPEESIFEFDTEDNPDVELDENFHPPLVKSFSIHDGLALQDRVCALEKEMEILQSKIAAAASRSRDEANEEVKMKRQHESVAQLRTQMDALKKELALREDTVKSLQQQLERAVAKAIKEREELRKRYETKFWELKKEYEDNAHVVQMRLISRLDGERVRLEESYSGRITASEVLKDSHFVVRQVENNEVASSVPRLICSSCKELYLPDESQEERGNRCFFHPLPPMKKNTWEKGWLPDIDGKKYKNYCYWACCNTLAKKRPVGCCEGRHHQDWEADILLKKVMQDGSGNTTKMLEKSMGEVTIITD